MKRSLIVAAVLLAAAFQTQAADKHPFAAKGLMTETCSCRPPCKCDLSGVPEKSCEGVGAFQLSGGSYDGKDLAGLKAAYAVEPGEWVRVYIQAANDEQRKAGEAFFTSYFSAWGKLESVKDAKIEIAGENGNYTVSVDDGKIMKYETKVTLGGDQKTAMAHTNVNDPLNHVLKQGSSESATYSDGGHSFTLEKGRNAYFNDELDSKGEL